MWILILIVYTSPLSDGHAVSITTQQMSSQQTCMAAGQAATKMQVGFNLVKFTCAKN